MDRLVNTGCCAPLLALCFVLHVLVTHTQAMSVDFSMEPNPPVKGEITSFAAAVTSSDDPREAWLRVIPVGVEGEKEIAMKMDRLNPEVATPPFLFSSQSDLASAEDITYKVLVDVTTNNYTVLHFTVGSIHFSNETMCPSGCDHGECVAYDHCACDRGWTEKDCSKAICKNDCSGHGVCVRPGICQCDDGYSGDSCEKVSKCAQNELRNGCFKREGLACWTCDGGNIALDTKSFLTGNSSVTITPKYNVTTAKCKQIVTGLIPNATYVLNVTARMTGEALGYGYVHQAGVPVPQVGFKSREWEWQTTQFTVALDGVAVIELSVYKLENGTLHVDETQILSISDFHMKLPLCPDIRNCSQSGNGSQPIGPTPVPVPGFYDTFKSGLNASRWWRGCKQWGGWQKICTNPDCTYSEYIPCDGTNDNHCCKDTPKLRRKCGTEGSRDYINGGVIPPNTFVSQEAGEDKPTLKLEAHGDMYKPDPESENFAVGLEEKGCGVKSEDDEHRFKRVGAAAVTKDYYASGRYEVVMKVAPELGVCSTLWTFYYMETYPGDKEYDEVCLPKGKVPCPHWDDTASGNAYHADNHEIDIEIPTMATFTRTGNVTSTEISFENHRLNTWTGEVGGYEYEDLFFSSGLNHADGEFHTYVIDWHTGDKAKGEERRVEFSVDGDLKDVTYDDRYEIYLHNKLYKTVYYRDDRYSRMKHKVVPTRAGKFWIGAWFPPRWTGSPRFDTAQMVIDSVRIDPYFEDGDEWEPESFADAEVCEGMCPYPQRSGPHTVREDMVLWQSAIDSEDEFVVASAEA